MPMKVLIVDDHAVVRAGIRQIVREYQAESDIHEVSSVADAEEILKKIPVDMVLLDISLPDKNGIDLLKYISKEYPNIPVLVLSIYPPEQYAARAIKAGARGYLTKESAADELIAAIEKIKLGGRYLPPEVEKVLAHTTDDARSLHADLSDREFQVLCLIGSGMSVSEVAEKMHLSVKTISTYRKRILAKTGMHNNAELTHYALKQGLVE